MDSLIRVVAEDLSAAFESTGFNGIYILRDEMKDSRKRSLVERGVKYFEAMHRRDGPNRFGYLDSTEEREKIAEYLRRED